MSIFCLYLLYVEHKNTMLSLEHNRKCCPVLSIPGRNHTSEAQLKIVMGVYTFKERVTKKCKKVSVYKQTKLYFFLTLNLYDIILNKTKKHRYY